MAVQAVFAVIFMFATSVKAEPGKYGTILRDVALHCTFGAFQSLSTED